MLLGRAGTGVAGLLLLEEPLLPDRELEGVIFLITGVSTVLALVAAAVAPHGEPGGVPGIGQKREGA